VVARIEAAPLPPPIRLTRPRGPYEVWIVTAAILAVSAATALALGDTADAGVLVRAGALVHGAVDDGQWWRLISCVFVHVGIYHLLLNAIGVLVIGRLADGVFGGVRTVAVFAIAGIAGSVASYLAAPVGVSAGASGAVFGLLGAVFVELTRHRRHYQRTWRRGMWGRLGIVIVAQLGYGALYPMIDQAAHAAGLVAGAVLGLALSPRARWSAAASWLARGITAAFAVVSVIAGVLVVRTSLADTLTGGPDTRRQVVDGVALAVPARWAAADGQVFQPDGLAVVSLGREALTPAGLAMWLAKEGRRVKGELGELTTAHEPILQLPAGWEGSELEAEVEDALGYRQRVRIVICGRAFDGAMIFATIQVPETIARAAPEVFARLLASIEPA
jgi:membrane associated rhomboid family serine protease